MGTARVQGELWGAKARDWAEVQEPGWRHVYEHVFKRIGVGQGTRLLDVGCGAGGAVQVARALGAEVCGLDAATNLVDIARARMPGVRIEVGEMESLPFEASAFDVVSGFNSFQFAGDAVQALREARRVCKPGGLVALLFWGLKVECDLLDSIVPAVLALLPPAPRPTTPPRPPLSVAGVVDTLLREAQLAWRFDGVVDCRLAYPDKATAFRALACSAPFVRAERHVGAESIETTVMGLLERFTTADGAVLLNNRMRYCVAARE
jgi:SAM-dependent methyltransferase